MAIKLNVSGAVWVLLRQKRHGTETKPNGWAKRTGVNPGGLVEE